MIARTQAGMCVRVGIADAIAGFAGSAARAIEVAGFDAVEIHGANGYLLDQFLTDYAHSRTDRWGGAVENRVRLIVETFKAVRAKVGAKVPVGVRLSQGKVNDYHHKWAGAERDAEIIFGSLADAGAVFLHVTVFEAWQPAFAEGGPSLMRLAKRYAPKAIIFANGSLHNIEQAVAALKDGADIITIGRGALANPDLPGACPSATSSTRSTRRSLGRSPTSSKQSWRCDGKSMATARRRGPRTPHRTIGSA